MTDAMTPLVAFAVALGPGVLQGLTGGGGALLYLGIAVWLYQVPGQTALTAGLVAALAGSVVAGVGHGWASPLARARVGWLLLGAVVPALVAPRVLAGVSEQQLIRGAAAVYLVLFLWSLARRRRPAVAPTRPRLVGLGSVVGVTTAGFGVAGGPLIAHSLTDRGGAGSEAAVATAAVAVVPLTAVAALANIGVGTVDTSLTAVLALGAGAGSAAGVILSRHVPSRGLGILVSSTTILTIVALLLR